MSDAETPQLSIEFRDTPCPSQPLAAIGLEDANLLDALSQFDPYGAWRVDLETGMVYWTRDVFEIHGMPYKEGPIDLALAISRYHPDDRENRDRHPNRQGHACRIVSEQRITSYRLPSIC